MEYQADLNSAYRTAIEPQIDNFRRENSIPISCPECKQNATKYDVDHYPIRFEHILDRFFSEHDVTQTKPKLFDKNRFNGAMFKSENQDLSNLWAMYHLSLASLRYVCSHCNISSLNTNESRKKSKQALQHKLLQ